MKPALREWPPTAPAEIHALREKMTVERIAQACTPPQRSLRSWALCGISILTLGRFMPVMTRAQRDVSLVLAAKQLSIKVTQ